MDDERGAVPIVMGYVDNANALVTIEDAAEYLRLFEEIGGQLGAILNTEEKTIILTSTSGTSLVEQMINSNNPDTQTRGQLLKKKHRKILHAQRRTNGSHHRLESTRSTDRKQNRVHLLHSRHVKKSHHSHKFNNQQARKHTNDDATLKKHALCTNSPISLALTF